ncbi:PAS domain-containing protein [Mucilaginibacter ginkgonis]|uniref:PAS domain-containing protein n=1 Tax=Mucilaginibacter ginkgonis TaxID=2682091 RepID=A0A6I4HVC5_9SPHI|nr:PAS domain-containing protein [Mucilaginibacter ginkgonis]QQL50108.1 PAS domain-containing protein [Mucilaginibacter ginkgonis]
MDAYKKAISLLKDSTSFYTIAVNMAGEYFYVSQNYDDNFRVNFDTLLGKPFYSTLHEDDIKICEEVGAQCFAEPDKLFPATLRKHDGNGGYVITQWEIKAIMNENGQPEGVFCIGYNITKFMNTEEELLSARSEIEAANGKLSEIGFMQSHMVRKPVANIIGLIALLNTTQLNANAKNIAKMLDQSAKELDVMIKLMTDKTSDGN